MNVGHRQLQPSQTSNTDGKQYRSITSEWSTRTPADLGSCEERPGRTSPSCRNPLPSRSQSLYSMFSEQSSPLAKQLGKKIKLKNPWLFQSSRGKEKEAEFPCWHSHRAVSSRISSREHQNQAEFLVLCVFRNPLAWRNSEDLCLFLQLWDCKPVRGKTRALSLAQILGWEVRYQRTKGRYSSPCGYVMVSPTHPELYHLWVSAHLLHPFTLLNFFFHEKLHFIPLLPIHGTWEQSSFVEGPDTLLVPPGFSCSLLLNGMNPTLGRDLAPHVRGQWP